MQRRQEKLKKLCDFAFLRPCVKNIGLMMNENELSRVIVEIKSTSQYDKIFEAQLLTYLRLTNVKLSMVINFGERLVKNGIHRVVNNLLRTLRPCILAPLR